MQRREEERKTREKTNPNLDKQAEEEKQGMEKNASET